jgi:hypothetical protein
LICIATFYILTKKLLRLLDLPLTLHPTLEKRRPERHKHDRIPPELGFVCAALVVLKMMYGPDGKARLALLFVAKGIDIDQGSDQQVVFRIWKSTLPI